MPLHVWTCTAFSLARSSPLPAFASRQSFPVALSPLLLLLL